MWTSLPNHSTGQVGTGKEKTTAVICVSKGELFIYKCLHMMYY